MEERRIAAELKKQEEEEFERRVSNGEITLTGEEKASWDRKQNKRDKQSGSQEGGAGKRKRDRSAPDDG
jgi:hypothetical protein